MKSRRVYKSQVLFLNSVRLIFFTLAKWIFTFGIFLLVEDLLPQQIICYEMMKQTQTQLNSFLAFPAV